MTARPDVLASLIARTSRRVRLNHAGEALAIAAVAMMLVLLARGPIFAAVAAALVAFAAWWLWRARHADDTAIVDLIERREPSCRNLLITARALSESRLHASPAIRTRVIADADALADRLSPPALVPLRPSVTGLAIAAAIGVAATAATYLLPRSHPETTAANAAASPAGSHAAAPTRTPGLHTVTLVLHPPAYLGQPARTVIDPERIDSIDGTRVDIAVDASAPAVDVQFNERTLTLTKTSEERFSGQVTIDASGVLTVTPRGEADARPRPRVIAVAMTSDAAPSVAISQPARDEIFPDAAARVKIAATAQDDWALRSLVLKYTKVTGSGEQFEFKEGEMPLALTRGSTRAWQGHATADLTALALEPGDVMVYYAAATDGRPGREPAVSDSFVIEIGKTGAVISGGFAVPPEEDRHAISLAALIQKTERLHAQRARMAGDAFTESAQGLAVEQRMVRTEFLFMLGSHGHVEDEEEEAEHSDEIQSGRLENKGQNELVTATRLMTVAEQRLIGADTGRALDAQRQALAAMQRALSRQRYFLRTLAVGGTIDPSRRLTGSLDAAAPGPRPAPPEGDHRLPRLRALLLEIDRLAASFAAGAPPPSAARPPFAIAASTLAREALTIDARASELQDASRVLLQAARATDAGDADAAARHARTALARVSVLVSTLTPATHAADPASIDPSLAGAFVDALRRREGSR